MFDQGDRVKTPKGPGSVVFRRMAPPSFAAAEAYSVQLDGRHMGMMFKAEDVRAIEAEPEPEWHVVTSQGGRVLGVFGSALLADAQNCARRVQAETGFPSWLDKARGVAPVVGQLWTKGVKP